MDKILLAVLLSGFGAQLIKLVIYWFKHKTLTWHDLFVTGGMPSSHSAFVVSLATIVYLQEGNSTAFAMSLVLAFLVLRDSYGVRRTVGNEGKDIQKLFKLHHLQSKYHYALGHTPLEVAIGSLIGFIISGIVHLGL